MDLDDLAAHASVVEAVYAFVRPLWGERNLPTAWRVVDPLLRMCWAQQWAYPLRPRMRLDGFDPDEFVSALAQDVPDHPLWAPFERQQLRMVDASGPLHTWGATSGHRLIAPDIELVYLTPEPGPIPPGAQFVGAPFLMHFADENWRVLNFASDRVPEPGWPPRLT